MNKKNDSITILDIAEEAGVSYSTVSRVLSGYEFVKDATRQRVMEVAERMGYVVSQSRAGQSQGAKSEVIGLLVPSLDNGYIGEIARGVDEESAEFGYDLALYTTHRNLNKETVHVNRLTRGLADGLLLIIPLISSTYLETLQQQNFPYVLVDQTDPLGNSFVVESTNRQGAYKATQYLIELGHRRIGFITGLMSITSSNQRLDGYKAALQEYHIPFNPSLVVQGDFKYPSGFSAASYLLNYPDRPTAIFAANDIMALGALDAARRHGLKVPQDISILGFDDIPQAQTSHPPLTTVRQPLDQMGRVAVRLLIEIIQDQQKSPKVLALPTELIIRESCIAPVKR